MSGEHPAPRRAMVLIAAAVQITACAMVSAADPAAGRSKAQVCVPCHGPGGNSANPDMPSLAGQPRQFIATQLVMIRNGNRKHAQMPAIAGNLTDADIDDLAAYFSAEPLTPPPRVVDPDRAAQARQLIERHHCASCHGPALAGQQHIPRIAGQQRGYLRAQLNGFKAGSRFDMDGTMTSAAQALSAADVEVLADYLAGLK